MWKMRKERENYNIYSFNESVGFTALYHVNILIIYTLNNVTKKNEKEINKFKKKFHVTCESLHEILIYLTLFSHSYLHFFNGIIFMLF